MRSVTPRTKQQTLAIGQLAEATARAVDVLLPEQLERLDGRTA